MKNVLITNNHYLKIFFISKLLFITYNILTSRQVESDQLSWGAIATKTILKVNHQNITEPWWSTDEAIQ